MAVGAGDFFAAAERASGGRRRAPAAEQTAVRRELEEGMANVSANARAGSQPWQVRERRRRRPAASRAIRQ